MTKKIEESDVAMNPDKMAASVVKQLERGHFMITTDFLGDLIRNTMRGIAPRNTLFYDGLLHSVGAFAFPVWRQFADNLVRNHPEAKEQASKLRESS